MKKSICAVMLAMALVFTGCRQLTIDGVTLHAPAEIEKGQTAETALGLLADASTPEQSAANALAERLGVTYTVGDPTVATVDENGVITAVGVGSTEITVSSKDGKLTATQQITVVVTPQSIEMAPAVTLNRKNNPQASVEATVLPADAAAEVEYTSSDTGVVTVDEDGMITAVGDGKATVTATVTGYDLIANCTVTVEPAPPEEEPAEDDAPEQAAEKTDAAATPGTEQPSATAPAATEAPVATAPPATPAPQAQLAYGAIPYASSAQTGTWWAIDSGDSAYTATVENINAMRAAGGLPALAVDGSLSAVADSRCETFVATGVLSHDGASTAEIIASGPFGGASDVCAAWQGSPGHYAAIMSPNYTCMGVGCWFLSYQGNVYSYWCVTFA